MNILILGSGGREHAIAWKVAQSKKLSKLLIAPGNAGTAQVGTNVNISPEDFPQVKELVLKEKIHLVVVGPEAPLVAGVHDFFLNDSDLQNIPVIGPTKAGAELEGSKDFAKIFMEKHGIPTAAYKTFFPETLQDGLSYLENIKAPYVLKADGLAAGKGVLILTDLNEAKLELKNMLGGKFGDASKKVVIEEFLDGIELSVFALTDGDSYVILPEAKDYKRIGEGDTGLNTGGMGAVSPVPFANKAFMDKIEERVIIPTVEGLKKDGIPYKGFLFFGLIKVNEDPYVIEYNVRMGDPETEVVMPRIKSDVLEMLAAAGNNVLNNYSIEIDEQFCTTVMQVSGGYPGSYEKGKAISGLNQLTKGVAFHAGTKSQNGQILSNGGRVIAMSALGTSMQEALKQSYLNAEIVNFEGNYYRKDIGFDL